MNNKLICPFCQQELLLSSYREDDTAHQMWNCLSCQLSAQRKIWQELIRTRKALEQSEICCTEWEKQALDYKAENIALSGDLERTRKALDVAVDEITKIKVAAESVGIGFFMTAAISALAKIKTALEQKEVK